MKVAIYGISKNEERNVKDFMASVGDCPVYILDTGSSDKTVEVLRDCGAIVVSEEITPWAFDTARNKALSYVPDDVDVCISLDLDERLEEGWQDKLKREWTGNIGSVSLVDEWTDGGKPAVQSSRFRIHSRNSCKWSRKVHELLHVKEGVHAHFCETSIVVSHFPLEANKDYTPMLRQVLEEDPNNFDAWVQLAGDLQNLERYDESLSAYKTFLKLVAERPDPGMSFRCSIAWIGVAQCAFKLNRMKEMQKAFLFAVAEEPDSREAWTHLAHLMLQMGNAPLAYGCAVSAKKITTAPSYVVKDLVCWGDLPNNIAKQAFAEVITGVE